MQLSAEAQALVEAVADLSAWRWYGVAAILALVAYSYRADLTNLFTWAKGIASGWMTRTTTGTTSQVATDPVPVLRALAVKFKDKPEALAAVKVVWSHLLDGEAS